MDCLVHYFSKKLTSCTFLKYTRMTPKVTTGYTKELCTKISNSLKLFSCAFFFQNIVERKLCNCFGQLLHVYPKIMEHGVEHDVDSAFNWNSWLAVVWINTVEFKQMMNLINYLVCNLRFLYMGRQSFQVLVASEYCKSLE